MTMDDLFLRGIEEFNRQYFFEAHDLWEELWMETTGSDRLFYQGLIQTAVGFYHLTNGNFKGSYSQFGKALAKLEQYLPSYHGIDTESLVGSLKVCREQVDELREGRGAAAAASALPLIRFV
jgi:predicted metal-dependent hydrolase